MWSCGVILYIILAGYFPFQAKTQAGLMRRVMNGKFEFHADYWKGISDEAKSLISGLLCVDQRKRLTVAQAMEHPWVGELQLQLLAC